MDLPEKNPPSDAATATQTALGKRLIAGDGVPADPHRGAALIAAAAQQGDAEAAALAAVLIGMSARSLADWTKALEYLQQAAEAGWVPAQRQLAVLGNSALAEAARESKPPLDLWGRLRRSVDIIKWFQFSPLRAALEGPRIALGDSFLPTQVCAWLIERARGGLEPSRVFAPSGEVTVVQSRSNRAFEFDLLAADLVLLLTRARMAKAAGFQPQSLEQTNVLHYATGQEFRRHYDFLDPALPGHGPELQKFGQRVATFLVYLNEDYAGAETEFGLLDKQFRCPTGGALYFHNVDSSVAPDRRTLHAGLPPTTGEKWLLSQWIRGRPL
jgi:prolyl 4-hydroxylase